MSDNTADSFDQASVIEDAFREAAIKAAVAKERKPLGFQPPKCYDCGLDIPKERLELGAFRCVPCQTLKEKNARLYR